MGSCPSGCAVAGGVRIGVSNSFVGVVLAGELVYISHLCRYDQTSRSSVGWNSMLSFGARYFIGTTCEPQCLLHVCRSVMKFCDVGIAGSRFSTTVCVFTIEAPSILFYFCLFGWNHCFAWGSSTSSLGLAWIYLGAKLCPLCHTQRESGPSTRCVGVWVQLALSDVLLQRRGFASVIATSSAWVFDPVLSDDDRQILRNHHLQVAFGCWSLSHRNLSSCASTKSEEN